MFHGPPSAAVPDLERAVVLAQREGRHAEVTAAVWLLGVALSAAGRYGAALRVLGPLLDASGASTPEARLFASLAASTAASVHRGLGRHEAAQELDEAGLGLAGAMDEATFDATLGLATDAVGLADLTTARSRLTAAEAILAGHEAEWWRQRVRFDWARAEVAADTASGVSSASNATSARAQSKRTRWRHHSAS